MIVALILVGAFLYTLGAVVIGNYWLATFKKDVTDPIAIWPDFCALCLAILWPVSFVLVPLFKTITHLFSMAARVGTKSADLGKRWAK